MLSLHMHRQLVPISSCLFVEDMPVLRCGSLPGESSCNSFGRCLSFFRFINFICTEDSPRRQTPSTSADVLAELEGIFRHSGHLSPDSHYQVQANHVGYCHIRYSVL